MKAKTKTFIFLVTETVTQTISTEYHVVAKNEKEALAIFREGEYLGEYASDKPNGVETKKNK